ncbi:MAG: hypothetical protein WCE30_21815 [Mycobacterium sp.]
MKLRHAFWRTIACVAATTVLASAVPAPIAAASVGLYPGMEIDFAGGGRCSLGFIATNDDGTRLGVTAGHCSDFLGQHVASHNGNPIGTVVSRAGDDVDSYHFGITLIQLDPATYVQDAFFTSFRSPRVSEPVRKYGERTEGTNGRVTSVHYDDDPTHSVMRSTVVILPGDSGSPWYRSSDGGPVLFGISIGNSTRRDDDAYLGGFGFPINSLIRYVRNESSFGHGFTPVGP